MENTKELTDLEKLGHYFLSNNPVEALKVIRANILEEVNYKRKNMLDREEKVDLRTKEQYSSGNGDLFKDIDILFLSPSDKDVNNFWKIYVDNNGVDWVQKSGICINISNSTSISIYKVVINGKGVLFVYPSSTIVNWKSVDIAVNHIVNEFNVKYINEEFYQLAKESGIII